MTTRTTQAIVRFPSTFLLPGFDAPQPAGDYRIDHDEELIEAVSCPARMRVGAFIHLPAVGIRGSLQQMVPISPVDLDSALEKDHKRS